MAVHFKACDKYKLTQVFLQAGMSFKNQWFIPTDTIIAYLSGLNGAFLLLTKVPWESFRGKKRTQHDLQKMSQASDK